MNVHKTFRRRPGRLLNVLYTFNLRPVSAGDIQNENLMLMAHEMLRYLAEEIKGSFYTLTYDEYTNISNKEQLTLCLTETAIGVVL